MMNREDAGGIQLKVVNWKIKKDGGRGMLVGNIPNEVKADSSYRLESCIVVCILCIGYIDSYERIERRGF